MSIDVVGQVESFRDSVMDKISNRDIVSFKLGDITFDNNINVNGYPLSSNAMNKILSSVRVKKNFIGYKDQLQVNDWLMIEDTLKNANKNMEFVAKKITNDNGQSSIVKLFQKNEILKTDNFNITFQKYFDMILLSLEGTPIDFNMAQSSFDNQSEIVTLRFVDNSTHIDVLGDMSDIWKHGANITFDLLQYGSSPFFERQICTNGMVATKLGFKTSIRNKLFNETHIQKEINRILMHTDQKYSDMITEQVKHLQSSDISLSEFYDYQNFFSTKGGEEGKYNHIISKFFNETEIIKAYGVDLRKQSDKWLRTATSGRNAYDFLNDLTWIASHKDTNRLNELDAFDLQSRCSTLFFKDKMDLEDIAPKVNLHIGKTINHNN